jgi:polysaccharide biosynthesis protein PelA
MRILTLFLWVLTIAPVQAAPERWVVYYGDKLSAETFMPYDLIAFDAQNHPPLEPLKSAGKILLGYISLGEGEDYRPYFKELKKKKLFFKSSTLWKGHYYIDIRKPEWERYVNDVLIPAVLEEGFDGVMFDTMDSPLEVEDMDPKRYAGMREAGIRLIAAVRAKHPGIKIMINRGFEILPDIAPDIDYFMAESTYVEWLTTQKRPRMVKQDDHKYYLDTINEALKRSPSLKIYSVDYWPPDDAEGIKKIYAYQRSLGYIPYVTTIDLMNVTPEPK